jgi:SNF2 family DNA or RNA helicase
VIACDEAQKVKNPTAQITSAVKGMKAQLRLAMTGTPVENGLSELWCIVDWAQPGRLGGQKEFRDRFERPMREADDTDRIEIARQLQHELTPHYIRRVKEDVLDGLPPKMDLRHLVELGPRQIRLYAEIVRRVQSRDMVPIEGLQHLIAVASHAELFEESGRSIQELIEECPKLEATLEILDGVQAHGEKAILFTRYRGMQRILQSAIAARFGIHAAILNGEVAAGRRLGLVDNFNRASGFCALILSPEAAGVGLNIVGANHVVHYTRLWNPAKENQATDRAHRIGQTRPVTVHYPIIGGGEVATVEERLDALLEEKQALARDVVRPRESLSVERELLDIFQAPVAA